MNEIYTDNSKVIATLEARCKELESALRDAVDDVSAQLDEYQKMLPYKQERYNAQKATYEEINKLLETPTTDEHLQELFVEWFNKQYEEVYTEINCFNDYDFIPKSSENSVVQDIVNGYLSDGGEPKTRTLYAPKKVSE